MVLVLGFRRLGLAGAKDAYYMKLFTETDVSIWQHSTEGYDMFSISADRSELVDAPTDWQRQGLQQTATGYGRKLNSGLKINFNGRLYRLYVTCFSNAGSTWFVAKGRKLFVS